MYWTVVAVLVCRLTVTLAHTELLANPDFEESFEGNWFCNQCLLERSTDAYQGQYSARISARSGGWAGLSQNINLQAGKKYYFRSMVKALNSVPGALYDRMDTTLLVTYVNGESKYLNIGRLPHLETVHGWQVHGADITLGPDEIENVRLYFQTVEADLEYLVDSATFYEIEANPNWLTEANERIEQFRKTDITFAVNVGSSYNASDISLEVTMRKHSFPFGTAVKAHYISDTEDAVLRKYQDFFFDNFEYAVLENALKWRLMEWNEGQPNFDKPRAALEVLEARGYSTRGHCVFWEGESHQPDWLLDKQTPEEVESAVYRRAQYVVEGFKGRLTHWDVNNEELHGSFFKDTFQNTTTLNTMFDLVRRYDPDVLLFLNEFNIVNKPTYTHAYLNQALRLKNAGAPLYGIGIQSHIKYGFPNPDIIQKRLDVIAEAGLPLWITELDYTDLDLDSRANGYETLLRLYFSNPQIEGVLLWGFWDMAHSKPDAALVNGNEFVINAAGLRWKQLVQQEWNTTATLRPTSASSDMQLRGFQGFYDVDVKSNGNSIKKLNFTIPNLTPTFRVEINV